MSKTDCKCPACIRRPPGLPAFVQPCIAHRSLHHPLDRFAPKSFETQEGDRAVMDLGRSFKYVAESTVAPRRSEKKVVFSLNKQKSRKSTKNTEKKASDMQDVSATDTLFTSPPKKQPLLVFEEKNSIPSQKLKLEPSSEPSNITSAQDEIKKPEPKDDLDKLLDEIRATNLSYKNITREQYLRIPELQRPKPKKSIKSLTHSGFVRSMLRMTEKNEDNINSMLETSIPQKGAQQPAGVCSVSLNILKMPEKGQNSHVETHSSGSSHNRGTETAQSLQNGYAAPPHKRQLEGEEATKKLVHHSKKTKIVYVEKDEELLEEVDDDNNDTFILADGKWSCFPSVSFYKLSQNESDMRCWQRNLQKIAEKLSDKEYLSKRVSLFGIGRIFSIEDKPPSIQAGILKSLLYNIDGSKAPNSSLQAFRVYYTGPERNLFSDAIEQTLEHENVSTGKDSSYSMSVIPVHVPFSDSELSDIYDFTRAFNDSRRPPGEMPAFFSDVAMPLRKTNAFHDMHAEVGNGSGQVGNIYLAIPKTVPLPRDLKEKKKWPPVLRNREIAFSQEVWDNMAVESVKMYRRVISYNRSSGMCTNVIMSQTRYGCELLGDARYNRAGNLHLLDVETGRITELHGHVYPPNFKNPELAHVSLLYYTVSDVIFSRTGDFVVSGGFDGSLQVFNTKSGKFLRSFRPADDDGKETRGYVFEPNSNDVTSDELPSSFVSTKTKSHVHRIVNHPSHPYLVAFSNAVGRFWVWDIRGTFNAASLESPSSPTRECTQTFMTREHLNLTSKYASIRSKIGRSFVNDKFETTLTCGCFGLGYRRSKPRFGIPDITFGLNAFENYLLCGYDHDLDPAHSSVSGWIESYDIVRGIHVSTYDKLPKGSVVSCLSLAPNGKFLVSGTIGNGELPILDMNTFKLISTLKTTHRDVNMVSVSPCERYIGSCSVTGSIILFDRRNTSKVFREYRHLCQNQRDELGVTTMLWTTASFSNTVSAPSAPVLATCGSDSSVKFWDPTLETTPLYEINSFEGPVTNLAFPMNTRYTPNENAANDSYMAVGLTTGNVSVFSKTKCAIDAV